MVDKIKRFYKFTEVKTIEDMTHIRMCKKDIDKKNKQILQTMLFCVFFVLGGWLSLSYVSDFYIFSKAIEYQTPYTIITIFTSLMFIYVRFFQKKYIIASVYIVNSCGVLYAAYVSSFVEYDIVSVTFLFMLFAISTLYIDYGWRIHTYMLLCTVFYVFTISFFKVPTVFETEAMNSYIFLFLLFILGTIVRQATIDSFVAQYKLRQIAYADQLTGVASRRKLFEIYGNKKNNEFTNIVSALAMIDVDHFKKYNDIYGHQLGDECLRKIGLTLLNLSIDYPIEAYRYGGEEFVIVIENKNNNDVNKIINNLVKAIKDLEIPHTGSEHNIISLSIGVTIVNKNDSVDLDSLISNADKVLYDSKHNGRNKVIYVDYEEHKGPQSSTQRRERKEV